MLYNVISNTLIGAKAIIFNFLKRKKKQKNNFPAPNIIPRSDHNISRSNINSNALKVLYRLKSAGFESYLVGGAVRDLLLGIIPKDFDVATNAKPEKVRKIFRNCILVGRRFRLAHIRFHHEVIEVATFRGIDDSDKTSRVHSDTGMILRDNIYGTMVEDAWRRDFTLNALYYNIKDFSLVDYVDGFEDLKNKKIRMIGDPILRYHEDPVRMLRAVRLAAKLGFTIAEETEAPIIKLAGLLQNVPPARLFDEVNKWFTSGKSLITFNLLRQYGLFSVLFPQTEASLVSEQRNVFSSMVVKGFQNTDNRVREDKPLNPAFLLAVLLWQPLNEQISYYRNEENLSPYEALMHAMSKVIKTQGEHLLISQRLRLTIKEIWVLQYRFSQRQKRKVYTVMANPKFRAGYDFLLLREESGEEVQELVNWWTKWQNANDTESKNMLEQVR